MRRRRAPRRRDGARADGLAGARRSRWTACGVRGIPKVEPGVSWSENAGSAAATRTAAPTARNTTGRAHDRAREPRPEALLGVDRLAREDRACARCRGGRRARAAPAGASTAAAIETIGIRKPATPIIRMNGSGIATSSASPSATAMPGEDDRAAGGLHRPHDRVVLVRPRAELLAEAVDDEQRVVDRDPEADQLHEVRRVRRRLRQVRDPVDDPERARDRAGGEDERDRHRAREAEHERAARAARSGSRSHSPLLQVLVEDRVEVVLDRAGAGHVRALDAGRPADARAAARRV